MAEAQVAEAQDVRVDRAAARLSLAYVLVAFLSFGVAAIAGLLQGLDRGGVITLPKWLNYYQILTAHGVYMGLLFTTYFIIGFFFSGVARTTGGSLPPVARRLGWLGWWMMVIGQVAATFEVLAGNASVLYTFYAPMQASPLFYVGMALVVVGSWFGGTASLRHTGSGNGKIPVSSRPFSPLWPSPPCCSGRSRPSAWPWRSFCN